jgi:hypothetical protein
MGLKRLPPQITRLLIVTALILASYFIARAFLVPDSFGKYGWYRANALQEHQKQPVKFAGAAICADCHDDVVAKKSLGGHKNISCESCHGPQAQHVNNPEQTPAKITNQNFCLLCHEQNASRPRTLRQIKVSEHFEGQTCLECHIAHAPLEFK